MLFDLARLQKRPYGGQFYVENAVRSIMAAAPADWLFELHTVGVRGRTVHQQRLQSLDKAGNNQRTWQTCPSGLHKWLVEYLPLWLQHPCWRNADIVHSFSGGWLPKSDVPVLLTLQDVIVLRLDENTADEKRFVRAMLMHLVGRSRCITTISEFSKQEIVALLEVDPSKITVVPPGVDLARFKPLRQAQLEQHSALLDKYGLTKPYILHMGGDAPRKNTAMLVDGYTLARERDKNLDYQLVLVGSYNQRSAAANAISGSPFRDSIKMIDYLPADDLLELLQRSALHVFPSTYEGFGLPPLEAMACAVPVVCSDAASLPEVGGDAVLYFNPYDVEDLADKVLAVAGDAALVDRLRAAGLLRCQRFQWSENARRTIEIYEQLIA